MNAQRDPESAEFEHLAVACHLPGARILEIGCGQGQLTWQYAGLPRQVIGIDPSSSALHEARSTQPARLSNVFLTQARAESLPFPSHAFDIFLFASSF